MCLTQLSTIFQLCGGVQLDSFIGGRTPPPPKTTLIRPVVSH